MWDLINTLLESFGIYRPSTRLQLDLCWGSVRNSVYNSNMFSLKMIACFYYFLFVYKACTVERRVIQENSS